MAQYEVWCNHCDVTFPAKTRRCMHCGGRTSPHRLQRSMRDDGLSLPEEMPAFHTVSGPLGEGPPTEFAPAPIDDPDSLPDEEPGRRSLLRAGMSIVWMILLVAGYLWKSCNG